MDDSRLAVERSSTTAVKWCGYHILYENSAVGLLAMKRVWIVWKHALGSFNPEDGYNPRNENAIAVIRSTVLLVNMTCAILIAINILKSW